MIGHLQIMGAFATVSSHYVVEKGKRMLCKCGQLFPARHLLMRYMTGSGLIVEFGVLQWIP